MPMIKMMHQRANKQIDLQILIELWLSAAYCGGTFLDGVPGAGPTVAPQRQFNAPGQRRMPYHTRT